MFLENRAAYNIINNIRQISQCPALLYIHCTAETIAKIQFSLIGFPAARKETHTQVKVALAAMLNAQMNRARNTHNTNAIELGKLKRYQISFLFKEKQDCITFSV